MPQMSPMNWLYLFVYFNIAIYLTFVKFHFLSGASFPVKTAASTRPVGPMVFYI
uniref:ATP synthase F0 subunit 8 n=1 Tax=Calanus finmarchicus TaxID=6837 RepID=A0A343LEK5_CALFI|nr:ATP synthase F0 subunit 8 [Calanus finmarchicus]